MAGAPPPGEPVPFDGALPVAALAGLTGRPFGLYVHIPFCATRCGYCDFNTYTARELVRAGHSADRSTFHGSLITEIELAARVLGPARPTVDTVFFGGGTPTLLAADQFAAILRAVDRNFGLSAAAEITVEANPESVTEQSLTQLREIGVNRLSIGMQSASERVLAVLERVHTPGGALGAVAAARRAGFGDVSLDVIFGTPGETLADWSRTLAAVVGADVEHVSAYALIMEAGTRLAAAVRRGAIAVPDDDLMAQEYLMADQVFDAAGLTWYELSNWARPGHECRHNLGYWRGDNWWGVGPGAHSHVGGVRWWNLRHPGAYAARLAVGAAPGEGREVLGPVELETERTMLGIRLASGLPLHPRQLPAGQRLQDEGLADLRGGQLVLTARGRLLADAATRALLP